VKRFWAIVGALAVTLVALGAALWLGAASFDARRYDQHRRRLREVMRRQPTAERLTRGLEAEGSPLLAVARTPSEKARTIAAHGGSRTAELDDKAARFAELRLYRAGDMLYFVNFDDAGVMRDFTCVSR
jgi:hypothetical protein